MYFTTDTEEDDLTHTEMEHPPSEGKPLDDKSSISKQDGDSGDGCERENGPPGMDTRVDTGVDTTEMDTGMETRVRTGMETGMETEITD